MAILTKNQLSASNATSFPDNTTGAITPTILRNFNTNIIDTLVDSLVTSSFALTDASNNFTSANSFSSISASSFVSASGFVGDGSKITNITSSIALPILDEGIPVGNATSMNFTGSNISAVIVGGVAVVQVTNQNTGSLLTTASFNQYTASNDSKVNSLINATASYAISSSVAAVDAAQQAQINSLIAATASFTSLNAFTASQETKDATLATYTASVDQQFSNIGSQSASWDNTNLNAFTASQNTKNSTLASYTGSNDTKWNTLGGQTGSFITESETGSFAILAASNRFTQANSFTSISASSFVSGTFFVGDGSKLTNLPGAVPLTSLNAFTASQETKNATLETYTASVDTKFISIGASTSSLNTATASLFTSASLSLTTASFTGNTLTFRKGDGTTFGVVIPDVSGSGTPTGTISSSAQIVAFNIFATTGSNQFIGNQAIDGTLTITDAIIGSQSINLQPNANDARFLEIYNTGATDTHITASGGNLFLGNDETYVLVTTYANQKLVTLRGDQGIAATGSLDISGSLTSSLQQGYVLVGNSNNRTSLVATSSFGSTINTGSFATTGSNTFVGNQTLTGSLFISGNINMVNGADLVTHHVRAQGSNGLELQTAAGAIIVSMGGGGGTQAGFVGAVTANSLSASTITGIGNVTDYSTSVNSRLGSSLITASFSGSTLTFTKGDASTFGVVIPAGSGSAINTGSFATTGSNTFVGNQTISTGSLQITGSLNSNVVSVSIVSSTASMDMSAGNYFTVTLPSTQSTNITATNIKPGSTATLVITTNTASTASLSPILKQTTGDTYSPNQVSGSTDILQFVAVDSVNMFTILKKTYTAVIPPPPIDPDLSIYLDAGNASSYPGTGTMWYDLTANNNDLKLFGSPAWDSTTGSFDFANTTTTTTYYATGSGFTSMSIAAASFSIELWQKYMGPTSGADYVYNYELGFIDTGAGNTGGSIQFYPDWVSGQTTMRCGNIGITRNIPVYTACPGSPCYNKSTDYNVWRQLVLTRNGSTGELKMYVDGVIWDTLSGFSDTLGPTDQLTIGSTSPSNTVYGQSPGICQTAIFKCWNGKVVSSTEVLDSYNALKTRFGK